MAGSDGAFPPIVPGDDDGNAGTPAAGANKGEVQVATKRNSRRRHPSRRQSYPDDSMSSSRRRRGGSSGRYGTMTRHLSTSVYTWACGEKAEGQEEEPKASDTVIGWLILLFQALAYGIIILKAGSGSGSEEAADGAGDSSTSLSTDASSAQDSGNGTYSFASVTAAMYLLVATATPDLRSGFALLVDGSSGRHRMFGVALLGVFGLMITAAMELLFSDADDDVSIVTNSVTVLFVADVDEKALTFFLTVPQEWRLFWAMNMISLSISLAVIFVTYVRDGSVLSEAEPWHTWEGGPEQRYAFDPDIVPSWFAFAVNPAAVTYIAFVASKGIQGILDARGDGATSVQGAEAARGAKPWRLVLWQGFSSAVRAVQRESLFYLVLLGWASLGLVSWMYSFDFGPPLAWEYDSHASPEIGERGPDAVRFAYNSLEFRVANVALAAGLAVFAARWIFTRRKSQDASLSKGGGEPPIFVGLESQSPIRACIGIDERKAETTDGEDEDSRCDGDLDGDDERRDTDNDHDEAESRNERADNAAPSAVPRHGENSNRGRLPSRVPSLLVGWGLGYWATSVVLLLAEGWPRGGWYQPPIYVMVLGCILVPLVFVAGVFLVADANFFGPSLEPFLRRPVRVLNSSRSCPYWMMATILRTALVLWCLHVSTILFIYRLNVF